MSEPDYRPFLRDGDLVTAEDVLKWLRSPVGARVGAHRAWLLKNDAREWAYLDHYEDEVMLAARLDRERRRALRRGALEEWRSFSEKVMFLSFSGRDPWDLTEWKHRDVFTPLIAALTFRAAARAK